MREFHGEWGARHAAATSKWSDRHEHVRPRRLELEAETAKRKKRRTRLKAGGQVPGSAPRARPDRRERAAARHVGGGIDPTLYPVSPSARRCRT